MERKKSKTLWVVLGVILAIIFLCLCYWKRIGIRNTLYRMVGMEVPYSVKEKDQKAYGYYKRVVDVDVDLDEAQVITENDQASS